MTKIVRQGETRPGAMRRKARHAQTTDLPPRCGVDGCRLPAMCPEHGDRIARQIAEKLYGNLEEE